MFIVNTKEFDYPTICISIVGNNLVFTTKKNGSRYFEDLSGDLIQPNQINTINLRLHHSIDWPSDDMYKFSKFVFEVSPSSLIDEYIFLNLLGINSFGELFSNKVFEKFRFIFITRDPIERFFTGFFEKIDSILGVLQIDRTAIFTFDIIKKYFYLNEYTSLSNLPQDKINLILNEYAASIDDRILNDEHLSLWNCFLLNFLVEENLFNKVTIIDLNNQNKMNIFNHLSQPSNKPWLRYWLNDEKNKNDVDSLLLKFKNYFDLEMESYNILVNKKDG